MKHKLDIVICTKNSAKTLTHCLNSIYADMSVSQLIAVDYKSSDRTLNILRNYGAEVIKQDKPGVGQARQLGLEAVKTPFYLTVDSDVFLPKGFYKSVFPLMSKAVWAGAPIIFGSGSMAKFYRYRARVKAPQYSLGAAFLNTRLIKALGGFNASLPVAEDSDLFLRIKKAGYEIIINYDIEVMHPRTLIEEFKAVQWWATGTPYLGQNRIIKAIKYTGAGCLYGLILTTTDPKLLFILPIRGLIQAYGALK